MSESRRWVWPVAKMLSFASFHLPSARFKQWTNFLWLVKPSSKSLLDVESSKNPEKTVEEVFSVSPTQ
jgi:hypothetical protein